MRTGLHHRAVFSDVDTMRINLSAIKVCHDNDLGLALRSTTHPFRDELA
jgi:hypothetical protein